MAKVTNKHVFGDPHHNKGFTIEIECDKDTFEDQCLLQAAKSIQDIFPVTSEFISETEIEPISDTTIVSIFYPPPAHSKRPEWTTHRPIEIYMESIRKLANLPVQVVIFVPPNLKDSIERLRPATHPLKAFWVVLSHFEEIWNVPFVGKNGRKDVFYTQQWDIDIQRYGNPHLYGVWNSKFYIIAEAVARNLWKSKYFVYADAGIMKTDEITEWCKPGKVENVMNQMYFRDVATGKLDVPYNATCQDRVVVGMITPLTPTSHSCWNFSRLRPLMTHTFGSNIFFGTAAAMSRYAFAYMTFVEQQMLYHENNGGTFIGREELNMAFMEAGAVGNRFRDLVVGVQTWREKTTTFRWTKMLHLLTENQEEWKSKGMHVLEDNKIEVVIPWKEEGQRDWSAYWKQSSVEKDSRWHFDFNLNEDQWMDKYLLHDLAFMWSIP
ncbi:hypothetical protein AKO1_015569 [Acrasis kona]|uniref:Uncharacterized protein n=1 Tax=Acrasis kona TaxID=1008807 RepID=A0AAW2ZEP2_9EUKA